MAELSNEKPNNNCFPKGDNEDIVATDSQKNTVSLLAKRHGVTDPERFAMLLAKHFLDEYSWVLSAKIGVRMHPWERMRVEDGIHNHAFISNPVFERFTTVGEQQHGNGHELS